MKRIVVGTDFTAASSAAEDLALSMAKAYGAALTLVHVIESVPFADEDDPVMRRFFASLQRDAEEKLEIIATHVDAADVTCDARVEVGSRWRAIESIAEDLDADLIVLGARRDPQARAIATTGHKVFVTANRPVLFVPEA